MFNFCKTSNGYVNFYFDYDKSKPKNLSDDEIVGNKEVNNISINSFEIHFKQSLDK